VVCVCGGRGGGGIYSKEAIEILKWNLVFMFISMLVLWYRSEMTDSKGHGLHRNPIEKQVHLLLNHWTGFHIIWQKFSQRSLAQQSYMTSDILIVNIWRFFSQQHPKGFEWSL
jgi:hypothetical protein